MIRQAISCDLCASEKKQTNHWFVAYEFGGELRVSGWNSRNRLRPGSKHLCGQTCLHKLVDDFMARAISVRVPAAIQEEAVTEAVAEVVVPTPTHAAAEFQAPRQSPVTDTSLASEAAFIEDESSARLITPPAAASPNRSALRVPAELVAMPVRIQPEQPAPLTEEPPRSASRNWRAEAWERERERELRAVGRPSRRRSGS